MMDRQLFVKVPPKCRKHPRYEGKRKPRADCESCRLIWEAKDETYTYEDLQKG